jgi:hypothetical protein
MPNVDQSEGAACVHSRLDNLAVSHPSELSTFYMRFGNLYLLHPRRIPKGNRRRNELRSPCVPGLVSAYG